MLKEQKRQRAVMCGTHRVVAIAAGVTITFGMASLAYADDAPTATTTPAALVTGVDWSKMFTFSGYGTVGMTHSSLDTADYTTTLFQPEGAGSSSQYNFSDDTKVGAQVNAQFTSELSAVVQVIMQQQYNNSYAPTIEWANIKYAITPDFSLRVGRIALPSFLSADYRNVGYANPWTHVPIETYNLIPPSNNDGVDASYTLHLGKLDNTVQVLYGETSLHLPEGPSAVKIVVKNVFGAFDTIEQGALTARVGYEQSHVGFASLPADPLTFYNIGVDYDPGNWFVQGEWSRSKIAGLLPGYDSWYVIGGYRIKKFTPYVMYSNEHSLGSPALASTNQGQKDYSAGVRWDFRKNLDLKLQYDRVVVPNNSVGYFVNPQQGFTLGSSANVVSVVLDFVF